MRNFLLDLKSAIILLISLLSGLPATAQMDMFFTSDQELSSSLINDIIYDRNGTVWVATEDGLNRYDGSKFTLYRHEPNDSASLAHNYVYDLYEDADGNIIVGTFRGLQVYNPLTDKFSLPAAFPGEKPMATAVSYIMPRKNGELWALGNRVAKVKISPKGVPVLQKVNVPPEMEYIYAGIEDRSGAIWVTKDKQGVYRLNPNGTLRHYFGGADDPLIVTFAISDDGELYAGSINRGLYRYNKATDTFDQVTYTNYPDAALNIKSIYPDHESGKIYLATDGTGLKIYDPRTRTLTNYQMIFHDNDKLKAHVVTKDGYGNLWVGLFQKGVMMIPHKTSSFKRIDQRSSDKSLIGTSCITSLWRDANNELWVGTDNDGVYALNPSFTASRHFTDGYPSVITALYEDGRSNLWLGSYDKGCGIIDRPTGRFRPVKLVNRNGQSVLRVFGFADGPDNDVWIGTMGSGLFRYDHSTGEAKHMDQLDGKINQWINTVHYSPATDRLFVGTFDGLYRIDRKGNVENICPGTIVTSILEDPRSGVIWVANSSGLVKFNKNHQIEKTYSLDDGLPSLSIYSIEMGDNCLWISTNAGLSKFDPREGTFINYSTDDGLRGKEFYKQSSCRDSYGNLYFGGVNGISYFNPAEIKVSGKKLDLRFTDFYLQGVSARGDMKSGGRPILNKPIYQADTFRLSYDDNSFSIEFNTRQMVSSAQVDYLYSFDGGEWERLPNNTALVRGTGGKTLSFSNVKSGTHHLRIKAVNNGVESDELSAVIIVSPPWYDTWWAKVLYTVLGLLIVYLLGLLLYRKEQMRRVDMQHKHAEDIKEAKLQFFTNISHEIRTPLSLILSPVENLMTQDDDPDRQQSYRTIHRNGKRILRLVNEIMDIRKIDNNQFKLRYRKVNLIAAVDDVIQLFVQAADLKGITLKFDHQGIDALDIWVDPSNFDKILVNLISNAVKYTPEGGCIDVSITPGTDDVSISVTDTGIGIPDSEKQYVFDRFYQVENNKVGGTGIGLHLTHQLVSLHHGTITVADNPVGKGTRFTVILPLGNAHLKPEEIDTNPTDELPAPKAAAADLVEADPITPNDNRPTKTKGAQGVVYVAEDDEEIRNYIIEALSKDFKVYGFSNGELALEAILNKAPDLLISDVMMPQMDGLTLTHKIRSNVNINHLPIILLTAKNRDEDHIHGLDSGVDAYLTKPFNIDVLLKTAESLIDSRRRLRNVFSGQQDQSEKVDDVNAMSSDDRLLDRVMTVVNRNLSNPDITVEMIAQEIGISRVHLHRKLKELTNQSTRDFIRNLRLQQAAKLLREKRLSVAEVSDLTGFKHPNNFSTNFKNMFGMTPSAYCDLHHKD